MVFNVAQWKTGVRAKTDANKAAEVMNELEAQGNLNAQGLVDASRPVDAVMHQDFEWDDAIAGEEWRKVQARTYIAGIVYVPAEMPEVTKPMRMYFKLDESKSYNSLETIVKMENGLESLRKQAAKELQCFREKYSQILKVANAESELNALQEKLGLPIPATTAPMEKPTHRTTAQA